MKTEENRTGLAGVVRRFVRDWKKYRDYVSYTARAELRSETANAYLDWIWWVLEPFLLMIVYTVVFGIIFKSGEPYFPAFVMCGITLWRFFCVVIQNSASLIKSNKMIISRTYIPKQMLLLILMLRTGFKSLLSLLIVFVMMAFYGIRPTATMLLLLPGIVLLFLVTYAVGCFILHLGVLIEDMAYIVTITTTMLMYFTGVFWSIENRLPAPYGVIVSRLNPVSFCITLSRDGLLYGKNNFHWTYFVWLAAAALLAVAGTGLIYDNENTYVKVI